jgi:hypothetical protein
MPSTLLLVSTTPGSIALELHIPRRVPSLIVPSEAIVFNADGLRVAVIENGIAHFHKVTVTRDFSTSVGGQGRRQGRRPSHSQPAGRSRR